jgi:hypothetical protein
MSLHRSTLSLSSLQGTRVTYRGWKSFSLRVCWRFVMSLHRSTRAARQNAAPAAPVAGVNTAAWQSAAAPTPYNHDKAANRDGRDFGWERSLTRPFRDARRFPSIRWYPVPEATRTTLGFWICPSFKDHSLSRRAKPYNNDSRLCSSLYPTQPPGLAATLLPWLWFEVADQTFAVVCLALRACVG